MKIEMSEFPLLNDDGSACCLGSNTYGCHKNHDVHLHLLLDLCFECLLLRSFLSSLWCLLFDLSSRSSWPLSEPEDDESSSLSFEDPDLSTLDRELFESVRSLRALSTDRDIDER